MTKKIIWLTLIILNVTLSGCTLIDNDRSQSSKIQEKLMNMDGYACLARISHINNEESNTYETKQVYQMNGMYRFEVTTPEHIAGLTTLYNGDNIIQYNPNIEKPEAVELPVNNFRNQIFLGTFVENYLQSEGVSIEVQKVEGALTTILEAVIPGGSQHMSTQRLWIDQKTHEPIRMAIYNQDEEETITVEFLEFTYNPKIDDSIFIIE